MEFIKLKSFTLSKPNLDATKYTSESIRQDETTGLYVVHPVCNYFLATFRTFFAHYRDDV